MDTQHLIRTLTLDGTPAVPMTRAWTLALGGAVVIAALVFFAAIGPRPDFALAAETWRFLYKFSVTLALFATGLWALVALARPGVPARRRLAALLLAPCLLVGAILIEVAAIPADQLGSRLVGDNAMLCLASIPVIGIGPLAAFLFALRHGAPDAPQLAGAVAGLVAGGLAATFYAAHCTDDSPLFVATWYPLAVLLLVAAGALGARFVVRW